METTESVDIIDNKLDRLKITTYLLLAATAILLVVILLLWWRYNNLNAQVTDLEGSGRSTSAQSLSLSGNELSLSDGNSVDLGTIFANLASQLQPTAGSQGSAGANGLAGSVGVTGSAGTNGAAGPADPCSALTSYFCQGGNSFSTTALLGTNDANNLEINTASARTATLDVSGNIVLNRLADIQNGAAYSPTFDATSNSNLLIPFCLSLPCTVPGNLTGTSALFGFLGDAASVTSVNASIGYFSGSLSSATGLLGQFRGTIDRAYNLTGSFGGSVNSTSPFATDWTHDISGSFATSSILDSYQLLGGSEYCNGAGGFIASCPYSGAASTINNSRVNLAFLGTSDMTNVSNSAVILNGQPDPFVGRSSATSVNQGFVVGTMVDLTNIDSSSILVNGDTGGVPFSSSVSSTSYSSVIGHDITVSGLAFNAVIGENFSLTAAAADNYSIIGTNNTGAGTPNMRLNFNGNDSWLNLSGGDVGVGTATPSNKLDVTDTSDDTPASFTGTSGTCTVDTNAGSLSCVSDQKLKTNILSISNGLDIINQLQGVTYNWKVNPDGSEVAGFIAQDVAKVLPNLVTTLPDGTLTLNKEGIMPYIVEAVKAQNGNLEATNKTLAVQGIKIDTLSEELAALTKTVSEHEARLKDLEAEVQQLKQQQSSQNSQPAVITTP